MTFTLRSRQVYLPDGPRPATVTVHAGRIVAVGDVTAPCDQDLGDLVLLPGLVDTHVHVNEPGRTEWEGFATATRAAAAGGVTTIVDMPLNSLPPTTTVAALREKQAAATGQCFIDVGFWGGAIPGNAADLPALHDAGVFGFKSFLVDSGVPEFPHWTATASRPPSPASTRCSSCTPRTPVSCGTPSRPAPTPTSSRPAHRRPR